MPGSKSITKITTLIVEKDGKHFTRVWVGKKIISFLPTAKSQIRPKTESRLWKPGIDYAEEPHHNSISCTSSINGIV